MEVLVFSLNEMIVQPAAWLKQTSDSTVNIRQRHKSHYVSYKFALHTSIMKSAWFISLYNTLAIACK